jgi:hypothetical protein
MNYFAHGLRWIDDPYVLAGTALPDWLNVVDRKTRVRSRAAALHLTSPDPVVASVARGVVQHHADDASFHETAAFAGLSLEFCRQLRELLPSDDGFRPHFLGHILVELLLDALLIESRPCELTAYYQAMDRLDGDLLAQAVATIAGKEVSNLAPFVRLFSAERFLWDYLDDAKLLLRLNQVMRRVGLAQLPIDVVAWLPGARESVASRAGELLDARQTSTQLQTST